ncbi:MAG: lamin tail domain-containing protein, partial [Haloarculaceae archaeon]
GTVVVESTGPNVTVLAQRSATTDPLSLRDEPAVEPGATDEFVVVDRFAARAGTESSPFQDRLIVATIHADATGNDDDNLPDEYVVFRNGGEEPLDLSNWTIRDAAGHQYTIPDGVTLAPGATLTLRTGAGANTGVGTDGDVTLYWTANGAIWNNDGDTITVTNETGVTTLEVSY